jgi:hypothetical protein
MLRGSASRCRRSHEELLRLHAPDAVEIGIRPAARARSRRDVAERSTQKRDADRRRNAGVRTAAGRTSRRTASRGGGERSPPSQPPRTPALHERNHQRPRPAESPPTDSAASAGKRPRRCRGDRPRRGTAADCDAGGSTAPQQRARLRSPCHTSSKPGNRGQCVPARDVGRQCARLAKILDVASTIVHRAAAARRVPASTCTARGGTRSRSRLCHGRCGVHEQHAIALLSSVLPFTATSIRRNPGMLRYGASTQRRAKASRSMKWMVT